MVPVRISNIPDLNQQAIPWFCHKISAIPSPVHPCPAADRINPVRASPFAR
jgi:hypothetical protein